MGFPEATARLSEQTWENPNRLHLKTPLHHVGTQVKVEELEEMRAMSTQQPESEHPPGSAVPEPFLEKA